MTELELHKFVHDNGCEYHWYGKDDEHDSPDVMLFIEFDQLKDFTKILGVSVLSDSVECWLKENCICLYMALVCDWFDITLENIFTNKDA